MFLSLILNIFYTFFSSVFIVVFKQVNVSWTVLNLLNTGFSVDLKEVSQLTAILVYMKLDKS